METADPQRKAPKFEVREPMSTLLLTEIEEPRAKKPKRLALDPQRADDLQESADPKAE
jgi:hypothetical protein